MNKKTNDETEMLDEYDFTGGVRGKYVDRLENRKNVIMLEPDVAEVFTDSESVNQALRGLLPIIQKQAEKVHQQYTITRIFSTRWCLIFLNES
jgi:hypothetical protein